VEQVADLINLIIVGNAGFVSTDSVFEQFFFVEFQTGLYLRQGVLTHIGKQQ
jgi:hypothetical protein